MSELAARALLLLLATCAPVSAAAQLSHSLPQGRPAPADSSPAARTSDILRPLAFRPEPIDAFRPVYEVQERGRHTKRGALIGAGIGALGGLGTGVFISLLCASEGDDDDCRGVIPILTLLGAGAGALGGAIIGAAIPRRADAGPDTAMAPESRARTRGRIGSASLSASVVGAKGGIEFPGTPASDWRTGAALRFNFFAELGDWFALGPQLGFATLADDGSVRHAALALRASYPSRRVSPYAIADIGAYQARQDVQAVDGQPYHSTLEFLGGSVGAGARIFPFSSPRTFLDVDARWHRHAQNIAPFDMTAFSIGLGRVW